MADQNRPAHVSITEENADWRCDRPLFKNGQFRINSLERTGNNAAISPTGCCVCGSQRSVRPPGLVWSRSKSAAAVARLAGAARSIHSSAQSKSGAIRRRQRDVSVPVLRADRQLLSVLLLLLLLMLLLLLLFLTIEGSTTRSASKSKRRSSIHYLAMPGPPVRASARIENF